MDLAHAQGDQMRHFVVDDADMCNRDKIKFSLSTIAPTVVVGVG